MKLIILYLQERMLLMKKLSHLKQQRGYSMSGLLAERFNRNKWRRTRLNGGIQIFLAYSQRCLFGWGLKLCITIVKIYFVWSLTFVSPTDYPTEIMFDSRARSYFYSLTGVSQRWVPSCSRASQQQLLFASTAKNFHARANESITASWSSAFLLNLCPLLQSCPRTLWKTLVFWFRLHNLRLTPQ